MRSLKGPVALLTVLTGGALLTLPAIAQTAGDQPAGAGSASGTPAATAAATDTSPPPPPPPAPEAPVVAAPASTGGPDWSKLGPQQAAPKEQWNFSFKGYTRAPMRIGISKRDNPGPDQSGTVLHNPNVPDDQYLNWAYTRNEEKAWTEMFFGYGNGKVNAFVSVQAFDFSDSSIPDYDAQFGISQGWIQIDHDLGIPHFRFEAKVGSFWEKYGQAGKYDAGKYDTYLFGRIHQMGEVLKGEYDVSNDVTLKLSHGLGLHNIPVRLGTPGAPNGGVGMTLVNHAHAGVSLKKTVDIGLHYINVWEQDNSTGMDASGVTKKAETLGTVPGTPDASQTVIGGEVRVTGGIFGELYAGYSHIDASHSAFLDNLLEVVHTVGGTAFGAGIAEQFFGPGVKSGYGTGKADNFLLEYTYSFGLLARKLQDPNAAFWGDGPDVNLTLFGMYTTVSSADPAYDGKKKFKYGGDVIYTALPWLGLGLRYDHVSPDTSDDTRTFWSITPRLVFKTAYLTHEEITLWYTKYQYGDNVFGQRTATAAYPMPPKGVKPDSGVLGIKATMWW